MDLTDPTIFARAYDDHARGVYGAAMARSGALNLWRETQAAGRARDRLELVVAGDEVVRADDRPSVLAELRDEIGGALADEPVAMLAAAA